MTISHFIPHLVQIKISRTCRFLLPFNFTSSRSLEQYARVSLSLTGPCFLYDVVCLCSFTCPVRRHRHRGDGRTIGSLLSRVISWILSSDAYICCAIRADLPFMSPGLRLHLHKYLRAEIQARRPRAQSGIIDQVLDFDCASQRQSTDAGWLSSHGWIGFSFPDTCRQWSLCL